MNHISVLRHHLATLAFRTGYALSNTKAGYPEFEAGAGVKTPHDILHHMIHLSKGPYDILSGRKFSPVEKPDWEESKRQFYNYLRLADEALANLGEFDDTTLMTVYQGPMCDAMTHAGQLMTLRRLSGDPLKGLHFMKVDIEIGKFDYSDCFG